LLLGLLIGPVGYEPVTYGIKAHILYGTYLGIFFGKKYGEKWARQDLSARARSIRPSRNPEVKDRGESARAFSDRPSLSHMLLPRDQAMAG